LFATECALELRAQLGQLGHRRLNDDRDGVVEVVVRLGGLFRLRLRLDILVERFTVVDDDHLGVRLALLALQQVAKAGAESVFEVGAHLRACMMLMTAGPRITTNIDGKMKSTVGKSILIGAFIAFSSAAACRRRRESAAWTRRIRPRVVPSWSAWMIARVNADSSGASTRSDMRLSASERIAPSRISESVSPNSSARGPSMCSLSLASDASKPRPASTLTASRSRASGRSARTFSFRPRALSVRA